MKLNKKVIESALILVVCVALVITAIHVDGITGTTSVDPDFVASGNAGVSSVLTDYNVVDDTQDDAGVVVEQESTEVVALGETSTAEEVVAEELDTEEETEEVVLTALEQDWQDKLMAKVEKSLYVRAAADANAEVVGKMYKGDRAKVLEKGDEWTKIVSGKVTGYVKNEFCVYGLDALAYAKTICDEIAVSKTDGLRIREAMNTEAAVLGKIATGDSLTVKASAETEDGWVAVIYGDKVGYVAADYVEIKLNTGKAITIEEEEAAKEEEAKEEETEDKKDSGDDKKKDDDDDKKKDDDDDNGGKTLAETVDDHTLLGALIQCEAGGQIYDCQVGVGAVVMNRMKHKHFPNTMYKVIFQKSQFGPAMTGKLERRLKKGVSKTAMRAAADAMAGADPTDGALYFALASSGIKGVVLGPVVFYKKYQKY